MLLRVLRLVRQQRNLRTQQLRKWKFCWLRLDTGDGGLKETLPMSRMSFLELLNMYNRLGGEHWKYWEDL